MRGTPRALPLLLALAACAWSQQLEIEGRYWITGAVNRARINSSLLNQEIDFERDLGVRDISVPDLSIRFNGSRRNRLELDYTHLGWDGDQQVTRTVEFNNRLYTVGTRVVTNLKLDYLKLGWKLWILNRGDGRFRLGPLVEGHGLWFDAALAAPQLGFRAADQRAVGYPTAGLALELAPYRGVTIFGAASGISLGKYGYFAGGEAGARVSPVRHLGLTAGYRMFRVNPKFNPDYVQLKVAGPFVGAGVRF